MGTDTFQTVTHQRWQNHRQSEELELMMKTKLLVVGVLAAFIGCGGGASLISGPDLLTYVGSSQITSNNPMRFSATITVTNTTNSPITFTTGCPIPRVFVFDNPNLNGTPIYDSNTRANLPSCSPQQVTLGANKSVNYNLSVNGADVLGASRSPGTYYVATEVTLDNARYAATAGSLAIAR
jgi:hypothetical protein